MINITLVTAPAFEPITLQEAKDHLRVDSTDEDALIEALITAARQYVERRCGLALFTQTWDWFLDEFPSCDMQVPRPPLQSVTYIKYYDTDGTLQTLSASIYQVDSSARPGRIALAENQTWPLLQSQKLSAVQVRFVSGYTASTIGEIRPIVQAMLLLIGHWYEHREEVSELTMGKVPLAADALLAPFANVGF